MVIQYCIGSQQQVSIGSRASIHTLQQTEETPEILWEGEVESGEIVLCEKKPSMSRRTVIKTEHNTETLQQHRAKLTKKEAG